MCKARAQYTDAEKLASTETHRAEGRRRWPADGELGIFTAWESHVERRCGGNSSATAGAPCGATATVRPCSFSPPPWPSARPHGVPNWRPRCARWGLPAPAWDGGMRRCAAGWMRSARASKRRWRGSFAAAATTTACRASTTASWTIGVRSTRCSYPATSPWVAACRSVPPSRTCCAICCGGTSPSCCAAARSTDAPASSGASCS